MTTQFPIDGAKPRDGQPSSSRLASHDHARAFFRQLETRLTTADRQLAVDSAHDAFSNLLRHSRESGSVVTAVQLFVEILERGPNDSRRLACQCFAEWCSSLELDVGHTQADAALPQESEVAAASAVVRCVNVCLRKSKSGYRTAATHQLSPSALRTAASALKALHSLLHRRALLGNGPAGQASQLSDYANLVETLIAASYLGLLEAPGSMIDPYPRSNARSRSSSSALRAGALSFGGASGHAMTPDRLASHAAHATAASQQAAPHKHMQTAESSPQAAAYDTDASTVGGYSESEAESLAGFSARDSGSDGSSAATRRSTTFGDTATSGAQEERKRVSAMRAVRQNGLHCLIALSKTSARTLYNFWPILLPDSVQAACISGRIAATALARSGPAFGQLSGMRSALQAPEASLPQASHVSLFTLVERDASLSVKVAAIDTVASLLAGGKAYLAVAQERAGKLPAFTSLSARLATLVVDLRACLLRYLQDAALRSGPAQPNAASHAQALCEAGEERRSNSVAEMVLALLRLTKAFAVSTARSKLLVPNAAVLQPVVFKLCSHADPSVTALAYEVLAELAAHSPSATAPGSGQTKTTAPDTNAEVVSALLSKLRETSGPDAVQIWRTLAICIGPQLPRLSPNDVVTSVTLAEETLPRSAGRASGIVVRCAVAEYLSALSAGLAEMSAEGRATIISDNQSSSPAFPARIRTLLGLLTRDSDATVRKTAATAFPFFIAARQRMSNQPQPQANEEDLTALESLAHDGDAGVRTEAIRAVGLILASTADKDKGKPAVGEGNVGAANGTPSPSMRDHLLWTSDGANLRLLDSHHSILAIALEDRSVAIRQQATWTLANWAEALVAASTTSKTSSPTRTVDGAAWAALARTTYDRRNDEASVLVHALRACGSLLALLQASNASSHLHQSSSRTESLVLSLLDMICSVLESDPATTPAKAPAKNPKVRWNAASALDRAVQNRQLVGWLSDRRAQASSDGAGGRDTLGRILDALCSALSSKIFKVKMAAAEALLSLCPSTDEASCTAPLADSDVRRIQDDVERAGGRLEEEIERAPFKEASLYASECRKLFARLAEAYGRQRLEAEEGRAKDGEDGTDLARLNVSA